MAVGSIGGALFTARRAKPRIAFLLGGAAIFGFGCALVAIMPNRWLFGLALLIIGVAAQTLTISTNGLVATVDRACHARACDGDPRRRSFGRYANRRADRRLGR
jgi:hypothetical protein